MASAIDAPSRRTPEGLALASEVRAHVKALKQPAKRTKFVLDAIEAGDLPSVAAVLHAPPFLSGLDASIYATIRAKAAAKFAPIDSAQLEATEAAVDRVTHAGSMTLKRFGGVLQYRNAPIVKAAKSVRALAEG